MKHIGQGRTADIFEYDEGKILKLYNKDLPEEFIKQEFLISSYAYSLGIHTPQPFELTNLNDRHGVVFQRISAFTLLHRMTKKPWSINKQSRTLARLHSELHTHVASGVLRNQKMVLSGNIRATPLLTEEEKERIISYLVTLPDDNKLCHGDFHPDNVLVDNKHWIIDWMTGMSGDPAGDVARSIVIFSLGTMPEGTPKIIKIIVNFIRNRIKTEYIKEYLNITRKDYTEVDKWVLPVAAARLVESIPPEEQEKLVILIKNRLLGI